MATCLLEPESEKIDERRAQQVIEGHGINGLTALVRDGKVTVEEALAAVNEYQESSFQKFKRLIIALVKTFLES